LKSVLKLYLETIGADRGMGGHIHIKPNEGYHIIPRHLLNTVTKMMKNRRNILVVLQNDQNYVPVVMASVVCMAPVM
jgi:hypothetical protein